MSEREEGLVARLTEGLSRFMQQMTETVSRRSAKKPLDQAPLDELEEMLIEADLGHRCGEDHQAFGEARFGKRPARTRSRRPWPSSIAASLRRARKVRSLAGPDAHCGAVCRRERIGQDHDAGQDRRRSDGARAKVMVVAGDTFRAAASSS